MKKTIGAILALTASAGVGYAAGVASVPDASTLNAKALQFVAPEKLDWKPIPGIAGAETVVLLGDPKKPGFYITVNRFSPGSFSRSHYHPKDRYIMVLSGTWWVGTGANFEPEINTVPMKAGTFVTHTGREVHYDGARKGGEGAVVMIFGEGPGSHTDCIGPDAEKGPGLCADAKAAAGIR
jgi:hypothetical protein